MHPRDLIDVAGLLAFNGPLLVASSPPSNPPWQYLEQYWTASRGRFESWNRVLRSSSAFGATSSREDFDRWIDLRAVLDEIFASEMLARVWTAVLVARDRRWKTDETEAIARNVLDSHLETRRRALALLLSWDNLSPSRAASLNRLRRRAERWTDVLLGGLMHLVDVSEFAFDAERAADFAVDLADRRGCLGGRQAWRLTLVALRTTFLTCLSPIVANPDSNARITASILGCFQGELFDSTGLFQSLWMVRLTANASDAQGMISELLKPSVAAVHSVAGSRRRSRRI
jgi:hypothetical protein